MVDDVAQDIVAAFYELKEFDRPQSEDAFNIWAFGIADPIRKARRYTNLKINSPGSADQSGRLDHDFRRDESIYDARVLSRSGSVMHYEYEPQFHALFCKQILEQIQKLPEDKRRFVMAYIDRGDLLDYARETGADLYVAMDELKKSKAMMTRIAEDMADERKLD